jgi:hypothetical protein
MSKLPAFQFYPADWRKDPGVQALGYFERGVWFEILCLMHESEQRGKLLLNGKPMPNEALARLLGLDKQILTKALSVLLDYGVASYDQQNALISRRMVRDEQIRQIRTEAGKLGGNPNLVNQNPTKTKKEVNQNSTPSSSSSSSTTKEKESNSYELPKKAAKAAATPKQTDDEFLDELKDNSVYEQINVIKEYGKAQVWCKTNNRQLTKKFFVNWLNRIQTPMEIKNSEVAKNGIVQKHNGNGYQDAGTRNAQRINNTNALIDELLKQGAEEQNLSSQHDLVG